MDFGWKHIWKLYGWKGLFSEKNKLFYFTLIVVCLTLLTILIANECNLSYLLIVKIVDVSISILPTLLGFNLGAYALIIGFLSNKNLLKVLTEKHGDESSYKIEKISGVFAVNIITQAVTLLISFLMKWGIEVIQNIHLSQKCEAFFYNDTYIFLLNNSLVTLLMFFNLYSIVLVIQNAINIFDFNQLFTYFSLKK
jgi:hypothetical protein